MEYDRHERMKSVLNEFIAQFIREEANTNPLITVTSITVTPNYRNAIVHVTTIPEGKEQDALIFLKRKGTELREYIKKRARLKSIPHIDFTIDFGERHRQHIDSLVQKIEDEKKD